MRTDCRVSLHMLHPHPTAPCPQPAAGRTQPTSAEPAAAAAVARRRRLLQGARARAGLPALPPEEPPEMAVQALTAAPWAEQLAVLAGPDVRVDPAARNRCWLALAPKLALSITRAARRLANDPALEPADASQEAFCVFCELLTRWSGRGDLLSYLIGGRRLERALTRALARAAGSPPRRRTVLRLTSAAGHAAPPQLTEAEVRAALATLPPMEQQALALAAAGYTAPEIAARLGVSVRTVQRLVHHARERLQS